jgi:hypothetical protein
MGPNCQIRGHLAATLEFTLAKSGESGQSTTIGNYQIREGDAARYHVGQAVSPRYIHFESDGHPGHGRNVVCEMVVPSLPANVNVDGRELVPLYRGPGLDDLPTVTYATVCVHNHSLVAVKEERRACNITKTQSPAMLWSHVVRKYDENSNLPAGWMKTEYLRHCTIQSGYYEDIED